MTGNAAPFKVNAAIIAARNHLFIVVTPLAAFDEAVPPKFGLLFNNVADKHLRTNGLLWYDYDLLLLLLLLLRWWIGRPDWL
jgi:hypothetical protein